MPEPKDPTKYQEWKRKIGLANTGKHHTESSKLKLSLFHKGRCLSEEHKRKISEANKGRQVNEETRRNMTGKHHSEETKEKLRIARFKYAKKIGNFIFTHIGHNEKRILDELENELGHRIIRQYECGGYHLDGYIPEINLAIEIDEKYHENKKEKDIKREEFIKQKLGCKFLRIKDYE